MKRIIIDLDYTICIPNSKAPDPVSQYRTAAPVSAVIDQMRTYKREGFEILIHTSRNVRTYDGDIEKIITHTLPVILEWLEVHAVPYDEVLVGKPWCGFEGFYVDDRCVRPSEFATLSREEIENLLARERA